MGTQEGQGKLPRWSDRGVFGTTLRFCDLTVAGVSSARRPTAWSVLGKVGMQRGGMPGNMPARK